MSGEAASERRLGREAVVGFGLVGSVGLLFADVLVRAGGLEYTNGDIDGLLHTAAFLAVLALAAAGMLGVWLARSRPVLAGWLLRAAGGGAVVASLNAVLQSQPLVGFGLLCFSGIPLLVAAWAAGWAEEEPSVAA